jgi:hypothetical protein
MFAWLLRLWHKCSDWALARSAEPAHHLPASKPYNASNLHSRSYH